jgi:Type I restriction modification DNA specificity domain.
MKIASKFTIHSAKSKSVDAHIEGNTPFISNGFYNNGVVGFVTPIEGERVFTKRAICISAFCEATIQESPFLPRGNGGSGMVVLIPKEEMSKEELFYYAVQINKQNWKFSFGRMVNPDRIKNLEIDSYIETSLDYSKIEKETLSQT